MTRFLSAAVALLLVIGCSTKEPPDGIAVEQEPMAPWGSPDTVSVMIKGRMIGGATVWDDPAPSLQTWLDEQGYVEQRTVVRNRIAADSVVGRSYYLHAE